ASSLMGDLGAIAVGGGSLYFVGSLTQGTTQTAGIFRVPLPGGVANNPVPLFATVNAYEMVADDNYVSFTVTNASAGYVARCPHNPGCASPPELIAPSLTPSPRFIAQDAVSIYWATSDSIVRVAK